MDDTRFFIYILPLQRQRLSQTQSGVCLLYTSISAAKSYDPARITRYVTELANRYHKFYNSCRVKDAEHCVCQARIALCTATKNVISNALTLLKITVPESM